ncbi:MBL fold metallo-hydrolase [Pseudomonas nitroreducens]|uniref:MBL fold metallo-hydrolase n=1 Tax=Pseudomonas nitroreducens TaxID=46680 RepID=UPI001980FAD9|nr:MBL fold metallo-hydrolase [Pseudomonas nitritireducens]
MEIQLVVPVGCGHFHDHPGLSCRTAETGQLGAGLGTTTSAGTVTLIPPTDIISKTGEKRVIDGLTYEFLYAPGSEAPAEMMYYIKEKKALNTAEDSPHTLHNTYSLRGAKTREPLPWSKYLNEALKMWGDDVQVMYAMHHWPIWGNKEVRHHHPDPRHLEQADAQADHAEGRGRLGRTQGAGRPGQAGRADGLHGQLRLLVQHRHAVTWR